MHKNVTKCNKTLRKWCINKHGASKIIDTFETYHTPSCNILYVWGPSYNLKTHWWRYKWSDRFKKKSLWGIRITKWMFVGEIARHVGVLELSLDQALWWCHFSTKRMNVLNLAAMHWAACDCKCEGPKSLEISFFSLFVSSTVCMWQRFVTSR
jgi:hypothetical protein